MSTLDKLEKILNSELLNEPNYKKWDRGFSDDAIEGVHWNYFPLTEKYFFKGNPSFSYEYKTLSDMGRHQVVMLRDGFLGLFKFFFKNPMVPDSFNTILLISKEFQNMIPKGWQNQVVLYEVRPREKRGLGEKLVVYGFGVAENFVANSPAEVAKKIKKLSEGYKETIFLLPQRETFFKTTFNPKEDTNLELYRELYRQFDLNIHFERDINKFIAKFEETNFSFYPIDQTNNLIADSYLDHYFYEQGGVKLEVLQNFEQAGQHLERNLSIYHKIVLTPYVETEENLFPKLFLSLKLSRFHSTDIFGYLLDKNIIEIAKKFNDKTT